MNTTNSLEIKDIARLAAHQAESVAKHLFPQGKRSGNDWCVGDIHGASGDSLRICIRGSKTGIWMDFANQDDKGDLVDLWMLARGISKGEAVREVKDFIGLHEPSKVTIPLRATGSTLDAPISVANHQALKTRLGKNGAAMTYLLGPKRGLEPETIKYHGLGLSSPYIREGVTQSDALVAPMRSPESGEFLKKSAYICIPGVTQNPIDQNGWMAGKPRTYYAEAKRQQRILFVCEGLKDVWRHWQALKKASMTEQMLLISGTHGTSIPEEWKSEAFWAPWDAVYFGQDNDDAGNKIVERLIEFVGREARRVKVPKEFGKDWTDFWQNGGEIEDFRSLLNEAPVISGAKLDDRVQAPAPVVSREGRFSYKPVDINGAYVNGHLYYPTETHVTKKDEETGQFVERLETIVIRSDRTSHRAIYAPAPPGTPLNKRVLKLSDGTIIEKEPHASPVRTWDYESIDAYLYRRATARPLAAIIKDVLAILQQSIWLPYSEDYAALALTVPVTYVQAVFESVPLLLLNGPAGSGKSQTGSTMARLCANGTVIGQVSAASAARLIDETRGFVALDDMESIAAKAGKDMQINEFVQALKVSYNKHTAVKYWTDMKTGKIERLDFFGVKLLSNTLGADAILGSRMIRIQTRKMPEGMQSNLREFSVEDLRNLRRLRNELHMWAFEHVSKVEKAYHQVYSNKTDRQAEIAAPLRTMAQIVGDPELTAQLEACLARQHIEQRSFNDDPTETLKEAVINLIKQGFETVTVTHIQLEMRSLLDANWGMRSTTEIPEWDQPEWLGRQLRSNGFVANEAGRRMRVYGKNLRLARFAEWIVKEALQDKSGNVIYIDKKEPEAFCQGCHSCPYRNAGCELQVLRARDESRKAKSAVN